jgi:hypothetical protein
LAPTAHFAGRGSGRYDRERGSLQVNHRGRKLNLFTSYGVNQGGSYWLFKSYRDWSEDGERNLVDQTNYLHFWDWGHNAKAGVDYQVGKNTTLGAVWTGQWNTHREKGPTDTRFRRAKTSRFTCIRTPKKVEQCVQNQIANLNLQHTFGPKGGQFPWTSTRAFPPRFHHIHYSPKLSSGRKAPLP